MHILVILGSCFLLIDGLSFEEETVRLKLDVQDLRGERILDVDGQGLGGLKNFHGRYMCKNSKLFLIKNSSNNRNNKKQIKNKSNNNKNNNNNNNNNNNKNNKMQRQKLDPNNNHK